MTAWFTDELEGGAPICGHFGKQEPAPITMLTAQLDFSKETLANRDPHNSPDVISVRITIILFFS